MENNLFKKVVFIFSVFFGLAVSASAKAVCPVCTVAIVACVGLSRWFGVDDSISGIWIGGLIISMIVWTLSWLNKKNIKFAFKKIIVILAFYLLTIVPLYYTNIIGHPLNKMWGVDKILLGIIVGTIVILLAIGAHNLLKKKNQGKSYFPFQKVALPLSFLIIISLIFHFSIGCPK